MFYVKIVLATVVALVLWAALVGIGALNGWWHTPLAPGGDTRAFMDAAIEIVKTKNRGNVALVLIENGEIFDEHYAASDQRVDRDTIFPTASMSKWITAWGVMNLVQEGKVDLDFPVSTYLTRWQLPPSEYNNEEVTVRRLLSHMSGLSDGLGFGDYRPDEQVPSLEESLSQPRASSAREVEIALGRVPGTQWEYSGGGYLILQLLIEEVSGETFESYMQRSIFQPLAMSRSTFHYIGTMENTSKSYDANGQPATLFQYAASGATGFATSAADMARFIRAQLADPLSLNPLRQDTIKSMREPHARSFGADIWGLGTILYAPTKSGDAVYGHDGQNEPAINAAVRINPDTGDAIVLLVSGGQSLATMLGFEWVFWQTGLPDVLGIGSVIESAVRVIIFGSILILILAIAGAWRLRRRTLAK